MIYRSGKNIAPIIFEKRFGIHIIGLIFPIDVLATESGLLSPRALLILSQP